MSNDLDHLWSYVCELAEVRLTNRGRVPPAFLVVGHNGKVAEVAEHNAETKQAALRIVALAAIALDAEAIVQIGEARVTKQPRDKRRKATSMDCLMVFQVETHDYGAPTIRQHIREIVRADDGALLEVKPMMTFPEDAKVALAITNFLPKERPDEGAQELARKLLAAIGNYAEPSSLH